MKTVFDYDNYYDACRFLQDKYDKLGFVRKDYYHYNKHGKLVKAADGHGKDGLQYHHIYEDTVPNLCDFDIASVNKIEYQSADNMCYANLYEHLWLHILIAENNTVTSDIDEEYMTGVGGIKYIFTLVNDILFNSKESSYYNANNIITDNKDLYFKIANRACTSAFIRQRLSKEPSELAELFGLSFLDKESLARVTETLVFSWNVNAVVDLENFLREHQSAIIYICTGGGKTTTALEYLRAHNYQALVLGSANTIGDSWKNVKNVEYMNYQTYMNCYKTINYDNYNCIICDEAHHTKAERWGEGIRWLLKNKQDIKIIGLTATPTQEQFDGRDVEFTGRICYGLDIVEGLKSGIIYPFSYISSIYNADDTIDELLKFGDVGRQLYGRLSLLLNKIPAEEILRKRMPDGLRKIGAFCQSITDIESAKEIMLKYDPSLDIRTITSKCSKEDIESAKRWFNETTDHNVCLLTVNMINEGAHYNGINTLVMFRTTASSTLYCQQLGRIITLMKDRAGNDRPNPNGIVFDFVNNAESLINANNKSNLSVADKQTKAMIAEIKETLAAYKSNQVIVEDYTENVAKLLSDLKTSTNAASVASKFSDILVSNNINIADLFDNKVGDYNKTSRKKSAKADHALVKQLLQSDSTVNNDSSGNKADKGCTKTSSPAISTNDFDKLVNAVYLALRRTYCFYQTDFDNDGNMLITDSEAFEETLKQIGFKDAVLFKQFVDKLGDLAQIIAISLN